MRKWIVPRADDPKKLDIIGSHHEPKGAFCEAPDSFTNEMRDYFLLRELTHNDGRKGFSVELNGRFWEMEKEQQIKKAQEAHLSNTKYTEAIKKAEDRKYFNSLKPHQRFVHSIFGKRAEKPKSRLGRKLARSVFKDKFKGE